MTVTILAPAYDEEAVIADFVAAVVPALGPGDELLVVDDGSTDGTPRILSRLVGRHPVLRVVTHSENRGLGAALATGFAQARGDVVVTIDADLSHPIALLPDLLAACADADVAFASRFVPGGGMHGVPAGRALISRTANAAVRRLMRIPVRDMTTGYRAYRREVVAGLHLVGTRFETQLEITVRLIDRGARVVEVPLMLADRAAGESKMRYLQLIPAYGAMMLRMMALRWFGVGRVR